MKYKNLILLTQFSKQQKLLKDDIKKYIKKYYYNRSLVIYKPPIKDIVIYKSPINDLVVNNS